MGKKRLDSDKHYGGKEICSSPRQQGRQSRITSLYIRRRAAAVFLFSSLPISSTFLLFMSSWSLSFHSLTLRNATHWWLGAGPHGDQRGEKEEAGEKHREEPWSGLTYCIFSSQTCLLVPLVFLGLPFYQNTYYMSSIFIAQVHNRICTIKKYLGQYYYH